MNKYFKSLVFGLFVAWLPALVCAENFFSGIGSSLLLLCLVIVIGLIGYFLKIKLNGTIRVVTYVVLVIAQLVVAGIIFNASNNTELQNYGLYLSILMANIVVLGHVELIDQRETGLKYSALIMCICLIFASGLSLLREIIGFGTITYWFDGSFIRILDSKYTISFFGELSGGVILGIFLWAIAFLMMVLTDKKSKYEIKDKT